MSAIIPNVFSTGGEFDCAALTAAINEIDHVPGRAGNLVFEKPGVSEGVETLTVAIEREQDEIRLIQTTTRGSPAEKEVQSKRTLRDFAIPHVKLEDTLYADTFQGVRMFGTNEPVTIDYGINKQMKKMSRRLDLTLEHLRLGALKGEIKDADGSVLVNLYEKFEFLNSLGQPEPETFNFDLGNSATQVRVKCQEVTRAMLRAVKMPLVPSNAFIWALVGDDFFDGLLAHESVKEAWLMSSTAPTALGGNYAFSAFEFGGIVWENYYGTDDHDSEGGTVGIAPDEARFFFTGDVPGLYQEYFAPATFIETVNTKGLPRYAKAAPDPRLNEWVELHVQMNPLPICLRPQTLMRATA